MQDVKRNIDSLALMNVLVKFDELSIRVLNGLGPAYSNISYSLQVRETSITFEELFEQLLSYEAQLKVAIPSSPSVAAPATALLAPTSSFSSHQPNNCGERNNNWYHQL